MKTLPKRIIKTPHLWEVSFTDPDTTLVSNIQIYSYCEKDAVVYALKDVFLTLWPTDLKVKLLSENSGYILIYGPKQGFKDYCGAYVAAKYLSPSYQAVRFNDKWVIAPLPFIL